MFSSVMPRSVRFRGFFPGWWVLGSRVAVLSEHKGQNFRTGWQGGAGPASCLPLGADTAVISALPQLPPPPRLTLPSCVKTPASPACWPCTPGRRMVSTCCGRGAGLRFLLGRAIDLQPVRLWACGEALRGLWAGGGGTSLSTGSGLQPCVWGVGHGAAGCAPSAGPGDPTNEGLGKRPSSCLEREGVGVLLGVTLGRGTGDRGCGGPGFQVAQTAPTPGLPIPLPGLVVRTPLELGWAPTVAQVAVGSQGPRLQEQPCPRPWLSNVGCKLPCGIHSTPGPLPQTGLLIYLEGRQNRNFHQRVLITRGHSDIVCCIS